MPRRSRRPPTTGPGTGSAGRREFWRGESFEVRSVRGETTKTYRCPGCDQLVTGGVQHVVAWPTEDLEGDDRRHWHSACWAAREHRAPTRRWS